MDWTEIIISIDVKDVDAAGAIAQMAAAGGIYIEDYSNLEKEALEIARIDLIDEDLLKKDRTKALVHIYISPEDNPAEFLTFLSERLTAQGVAHQIESRICKNEDWENNWKQYYKPLCIGEQLYIRPLWIDDYDAQGRTVLSIEPGVAFGTGTHETTRLCLEAIERYMKKEPRKSVLDIGCGSGILSVAALLLGAEKAVAVDIDPLAVKMSRSNGLSNDYSEPIYTVIEGNLADKVCGEYDLVVANIVADAVIMLSKDARRFMKKDAVYITSGIIDLREQEVLEAFSECGLRVIERCEERGWLCFVTMIDE